MTLSDQESSHNATMVYDVYGLQKRFFCKDKKWTSSAPITPIIKGDVENPQHVDTTMPPCGNISTASPLPLADGFESLLTIA